MNKFYCKLKLINYSFKFNYKKLSYMIKKSKLYSNVIKSLYKIKIIILSFIFLNFILVKIYLIILIILIILKFVFVLLERMKINILENLSNIMNHMELIKYFYMIIMI
jgi:hypothetical protein